MVKEIKDKYLYLFASCIPVKGYSRSTICDIERNNIYFIDNSYYLLLSELNKYPIGEVEKMLDNQKDIIEFDKFIKFLVKEELAAIVDDISVFPAIDIEWDHPSIIINCIIDIREQIHDFKKIFVELDELNVYSIQIRCYSCIQNREIEQILSYTIGKNFRDIQILLKYNDEFTSIGKLNKILEDYHNLNIFVHSTPETAIERIKKLRDLPSRIEFSQQEINSCEQCGIINQDSLEAPSIEVFMENRLYNGCLNRKISIDENGEIKNCPSMKKSYGNTKNSSLKHIANDNSFQSFWSIKKDLIEVCKECEYRYLCTDCRVYICDENNIYSKPAKCKYDPTVMKWLN